MVPYVTCTETSINGPYEVCTNLTFGIIRIKQKQLGKENIQFKKKGGGNEFLNC